jgi:adenine-specific DNA-methyltransferase
MYEVEYTPRSGKDRGKKVSHFYVGNTVRRVIWLSDVAYEKDGELIKKERLGTLWDKFNYNNVGKEGEMPFANGKKPVDLIKTCISLAEGADNNGLVLDFFAGSGSTGHAVLDMNRDGGSRKFILVQLPELTDENSEPYKAGYRTISDITIERNRRVVERLIKAKHEARPDVFENLGNTGALEGLGFKVFKLEKSCFPRTEWSPDANLSEAENVRALKAYIAEKEAQLNLSFDRDKLLLEILLKEGFKLDYAVEPYTAVRANQIVHVTVEEREVLVCLDSVLAPESVEHFKTRTELKFICLERALDTEKKRKLLHFLGEKFKAC